MNSGLTYKQAILANFFSACLCYAGLIAGIILGTKTDSVQWVYALAGGMFLYIALVDMVSNITLECFSPVESVLAQWSNPLILQLNLILRVKYFRMRWIRFKGTKAGFLLRGRGGTRVLT